MQLPTHLILRTVACLSASMVVAGCSSSDSRARAALSDYQSAAAANDLVGARRALLELVGAKDDVAEYWVELGKLDASTGSYGDAYYAFTRAYELDRSNAELLRAVTQLALRSGDIALAQSRARELEILVPGDPWVKITKGWAAISQSRFDEALAASEELLSTSPLDPSGTVLKARALIGLDRQDDAISLLSKQTQLLPSDKGSMQLLARIYVRQADWAKAAEISRRLSLLDPQDQANSLLLIETAFRSGNVGLGRATSARVLQPTAAPALVASVLRIWSDYWPSPQRVDDARSLAARTAAVEQKLVYAAFLSRAGRPADAIRLAAPAAALPVSAESAEANAVLGDALSRSGNVAAAKSRFDAVIAFDPGNSTALRGRSELDLRTGKVAAAIVDAQKLVTVLPSSPGDRLLLARCYAAAGNNAWAERTLWTAFQDIPADETIYNALLATKKGNEEATRELQEEFDRQREASVSRGLV